LFPRSSEAVHLVAESHVLFCEAVDMLPL